MSKIQRIVPLLGAMMLLVAGCSQAQSGAPEAEIGLAPELPAGMHEVTFVELGSVNCIPCRMMQPIMDKIEKDYGGKVTVVFHDVWTVEGRPYAQKYRIQAIPTQVFLDKNGNEFFRHLGFLPEERIVEMLKQHGITKE